MNRTLGAFFHIPNVEAQDAFLGVCWHWFQALPDSVRPARIGNHEPLKKIENAVLEEVLRDEYWVSHGRRLLGAVHRPWSRYGRLCNITLILELRQSEQSLCAQMYETLKQLGQTELRYMAQVDDELFRQDLELHQMLNSGLVERDIGRAIEKRDRFIALDVSA